MRAGDALPLGGLLASARPDDAVVAFGRHGELRFAEFRARVAALAARLALHGSGDAADPAPRWLLFCKSSDDCAVALMALAAIGGVAVLPPSLAPGVIAEEREGLTGFLVDGPVEGSLEGAGELPVLDPGAPLPTVAPTTAASTGPTDPPPTQVDIDRDRLWLELCTSGTTGASKRIPKCLRHLEDEVAELERCFGDRLGPDTRVFATVTHQHIYGLLFRVLWPLAAGRPFASESFLHAAELLPRMAEHASVLLASTPAHLKRLAPRPEVAERRGALVELVSSGGPLDGDTALALERTLGFAPLEVFGSTETGGVAHRRRSAGDPEPPWTPFPSVTIEAGTEGRLVVRSPFVSPGEVEADGRTRFEMGDRAEIGSAVEGEAPGFRLGARADRIVKVAEKRLSLPEMESQLHTHPWVDEAALLVLGAEGEQRVHAVTTLSPEGHQALADRGRRGMSVALGEHLAQRVDRVGLPRAWRYVEELPRNAQGKPAHDELARLFESEADAAPPRLPLIERTESDGDRVVQWIEVPPDLAFLQGHFEGQPIVPGVVQLAWVMRLARTELGIETALSGVEALKFKEALLPGQRCTVTVERAPSGKSIRFSLEDGSRVFTSGRFPLEQP